MTIRQTWESWKSFSFNLRMMPYLMTLVVAKIQHRPLLFWFVTGPVLKSKVWLKMCWSAIRADRELSTEVMFVWERMVRANCILELECACDSQVDIFFRVREPSLDNGVTLRRTEGDSESGVSMTFSSSTWLESFGEGIECDDCELPMMVEAKSEATAPSSSFT